MVFITFMGDTRAKYNVLHVHCMYTILQCQLLLDSSNWHCTGIAEDMGSIPVLAEFFSGLLFATA